MLRDVVIGAFLGTIFAGCAVLMTPAQTADVADTAATIAKCQAAGEACKADGGTDAAGGCYGVYSACMHAAGAE